jgi:hypothetical protein
MIGCLVATVTAVSKLVFALVATARTRFGSGPASTCHRFTSVAPFQFAYTLTRRPSARETATAGSSAAWPLQATGRRRRPWSL